MYLNLVLYEKLFKKRIQLSIFGRLAIFKKVFFFNKPIVILTKS